MAAILAMLAVLAYIVAGLLGLIISLQILVSVGGIWLAIVGFFFFPIAIGVAPWIPLVTEGNWAPVLIVYGGGMIGILLKTAAEALERR